MRAVAPAEYAVDVRTAWKRHPSEDLLEEYALGRAGSQCVSIEEHLLACEICQEALAELDQFILALRQDAERRSNPALAATAATGISRWSDRIFDPISRQFGWLTPPLSRAALAGAAALLCIAIVVRRPAAEPQSPARVTLTSFRGGDPSQSATAPAGHPLVLTIEAADVRDSVNCRIEIVNAAGKGVWSGSVAASGGRIHAIAAAPPSAGTYWVRLYTQGPEPIREFGLRVQ